MTEVFRLRQKCVHFPVWGWKVIIFKTNDLKKTLESKQPEVFKEVDYEFKALTTNDLKKKTIWIYLDMNAPAGTVAHEAYHAICHILNWAEAEHDEETVAYHLDYLVDQITQL